MFAVVGAALGSHRPALFGFAVAFSCVCSCVFGSLVLRLLWWDCAFGVGPLVCHLGFSALWPSRVLIFLPCAVVVGRERFAMLGCRAGAGVIHW